MTSVDGETKYLEREFTYIPPKQKYELEFGRSNSFKSTKVTSHVANISYEFNGRKHFRTFDYTEEMSEHLPDSNIASISGHLYDIIASNTSS